MNQCVAMLLRRLVAPGLGMAVCVLSLCTGHLQKVDAQTIRPAPTRTPRATGTKPPAYMPGLFRQPTAVPTMTPRPTLTPTPWVNCQEVIRDGDFEETAPWWEFPTNAGMDLIRTDRPHRGEQGLWLAGFDNAEDMVLQFNVPLFQPDGGRSGDLIHARLRFEYVMSSQENGEGKDAMGLFLANLGTNEVRALATVDTNTGKRDEWTIVETNVTAAMVPFPGETAIELMIVGATGPRRPTGWAVDNVTLEVCTRK